MSVKSSRRNISLLSLFFYFSLPVLVIRNNSKIKCNLTKPLHLVVLSLILINPVSSCFNLLVWVRICILHMKTDFAKAASLDDQVQFDGIYIFIEICPYQQYILPTLVTFILQIWYTFPHLFNFFADYKSSMILSFLSQFLPVFSLFSSVSLVLVSYRLFYSLFLPILVFLA